jgi:alpha-ketoglutarate-dependent taurine dioxygenase
MSHRADVVNLLRQFGWAALRNVTRSQFIELGHSLGTPWSGLTGIVEELRILGRDEVTTRSLSSIYGRGPFPLHTDFAHYTMPPRYVLLRNASTIPVRPTTLQPLDDVSRSEIVERLLRRRVWVIRGGKMAFYAPVLFGKGAYVRWDSACMFPGALGRDALEAWKSCLESAAPLAFEWDTQSVLALDNWRVLHGRAAIAANSDRDRVLERIVVS